MEDFLQQNGLLQLDLPVLSPVLIPEESIEVFETKLKTHNGEESLFLTPSPELFIKRLLTYGMGDCYYLGKSFRNYESLDSARHFVEFNMLEMYKIGCNYMDMANFTLSVLQHIAIKMFGKSQITYKDQIINLDYIQKITVDEAFVKYVGLKSGDIFIEEKFLYEVSKLGYNTIGYGYDEVFSQVYSDKIEPKLGYDGLPTIIYNFPLKFASLAKSTGDGFTAERFELYICGLELGNCFSELANSSEQRHRFYLSQQLRKSNNMIEYPQDEQFLLDLEAGLPVVSGIAIGFDRLATIFLNLERISDIRLVNLKNK